MDLRRNLLRLLALGALIAAAVVVVVVVSSSWPDSGDDGGNRAGQERGQQKPGDKYYFVQPGDSLSTIAEQEGIDLETLEQLNPDLDPQALSAGQRVKLR